MMHRLHRDIFLDLLPFVDGPSIIRLYATGDTMIMKSIETCLTSISLELKRYSDLRWPNLLSRFSRLTSLELICELSNSSIMGASIDNLPQSLERLLLEFEGSSLLCFEPVDELSPAGPWKTRESLQSRGLKFLKFHTMHFHPMKIGPELLSTLPSSLVELDFPGFGFMKSSDLALLPRGLESLSCSLNPEPTDLPNSIPNLDFPPVLTSLTIELPSSTRGIILCDDFFASLPSSLLNFRIRPREVVARQFPSNLTSFAFWASQLDVTLAKALPPHLTLLELTTNMDDDPSAYQWLPKTLTRWKSSGYGYIPTDYSPESLRTLPPLLSALPSHLSSWYSAPRFWKYWPRSAQTKLIQSSHYLFLYDTEPSLSSSLVDIPHFTEIKFTLSDLELLKAIPNSVTNLMISNSEPNSEPNSDLGINYDHIGHLDQLKMISVEGFTFDFPAPFLSFVQKGPSLAISGLKEVNLSQSIEIHKTGLCSFDQSPWSRNLESLSIVPVLELGTTLIPAIPTPHSTVNGFMDPKVKIIGQWLQNLPSTHLTYLNLQHDSVAIPTSTWKYLPRTLTNICASNTHVDSNLENSFRTLPSHLHEITLYEWTIADPSLIAIVPSLVMALPAYLLAVRLPPGSEFDADAFNDLLNLYRPHLAVV